MAVSDAASLAWAASLMKGFPASLRRAALWINRRAESMRTDISESLFWIAYRLEIGLPNDCLCLAYLGMIPKSI